MRFSEVNGILMDETGNLIGNQKVTIEYSCPDLCFNPVDSCGSEILGFRETYTDEQGKFHFNNLDYGFNFLTKCHMKISAGCDESFGCGMDKYQYGKEGLNKNENSVKIILKNYISPTLKYYSGSPYLPLYERAIDEKNFKLCESIGDSGLKSKCLLQYSQVSKDPKNCEDISEAYIHEKNNCFLNLAAELKDSSLCDKIAFYPDVKDRCYTGYYIEIGNLSHCSTLKEPGLSKDAECFAGIALNQKDFSICDNIDAEHLRIGWCQFELAITMGDIKYCSYIESGSRIANGRRQDNKACEIYYT